MSYGIKAAKQPNADSTPAVNPRAGRGNAMLPWQVQVAAGTMAKPRMRRNADGSWDMTINTITPETLWSPLQPMPPGAQDPERGAIGRQFDYLVGNNISYVPRSTEAIGFPQLRAIAENLDVLRLVIETRKDQMEALEWTIQPKDNTSEADTKAVLDFFEYPDRIHSYTEWMRFLLEERFVTDALTLYPRFTNGGKLYSLDLMDGTLIKPLCDETGRRPVLPFPAYQQIIKGIPAVDYAAEPGGELPPLIYKPANGRVWKFYGYSPTEQLVFTVNMALRREMSKLDYYTAGSIPDAFGILADGYTPAQIKEWQAYWDQLFENPAADNFVRRQMRWIPNVKDIKFSKDQLLKDEFDEWLARKVCYAFSVEPTPFVKQMNRATAQTQKDQSRSEGLLPLKKWWKGLMNYVLATYFQRPDLTFAWIDEEATDPLQKSQVDVNYVNAGIKTVNEIRDELGEEPLSQPGCDSPRMPTTVTLMTSEDPDQAAQDAKDATAAALAAHTAAGAQPQPGAKGEPAPNPDKASGEAAAAAAKLAKRTIKPRRGVNPRNVSRLTRKTAAALGSLGKSISDQLVAALDLGKASADGTMRANKAIDDLNLSLLSDDAFDDLMSAITDTADEGAYQALAQLAIEDDDITSLANTRAEAWAKDRAAELISSDAEGGELIDATRDMIRNDVVAALDSGASNEELRQTLMDNYAFSEERAAAIARTELGNADSSGAMIGYRASGVVTLKSWQTSNDDGVDEDCAANEDQGPIPLDENFQSGDDAPLAHPNCRCVVIPYTEPQEPSDQE